MKFRSYEITKNGPVSDEERRLIHKLTIDGWSTPQIGKKLGRHPTTVRNISHPNTRSFKVPKPEFKGWVDRCPCGKRLQHGTQDGYRTEECPIHGQLEYHLPD